MINVIYTVICGLLEYNFLPVPAYCYCVFRVVLKRLIQQVPMINSIQIRTINYYKKWDGYYITVRRTKRKYWKKRNIKKDGTYKIYVLLTIFEVIIKKSCSFECLCQTTENRCTYMYVCFKKSKSGILTFGEFITYYEQKLWMNDWMKCRIQPYFLTVFPILKRRIRKIIGHCYNDNLLNLLSPKSTILTAYYLHFVG